MIGLHRRWVSGMLVGLLFGAVLGIRALTEPKNDFRFTILGDRTGGATPQIYGRVWREVDLLHPDFVINVGDTIEGGNDALASRQWEELRPLWQRYKHKPYWILPLKLRSGEFPLHRIAQRYGVDYVISGHGHQFVRMVRDGILYMEIGSSGGTIRRGQLRGEGFAQGWFYHHVLARVKGGRADFTVKEIDGPMGEGRIFRAEDWDENGPKFDPGDPALKDKPET